MKHAGEEIISALKMEVIMVPSFSQYCSKHYVLNGIEHWVFYFENGYGASVVHGDLINGYELAVLKYNNTKDSWELCYDTVITDDVISCLDENGVIDILKVVERM